MNASTDNNDKIQQQSCLYQPQPPKKDNTGSPIMEAFPLENTLDSSISVEVTGASYGGFCGYKYRFGLYASHSNVNDSDESNHFHTFTITLYIHTGKCTDDNYRTEKAIRDWLAPLHGQQLSKTDLFHGKPTTIEGIGDTLYVELYRIIHDLGYELIKLSVYENPIRVYSVSYKQLDSTVNEISNISLGCIPLLNLEDDTEDSEAFRKETEVLVPSLPELEEAIKEVAVAKETSFVPNEDPPFIEVVTDQRNDSLILEERATTSDLVPDLILHKPNVFLVIVKSLIGLCCFASLALFTMYLVKVSGRYPQGSDTFCHLYRADFILKSIQQGNWFPLYDSTWYNGVEIMRYWGPLPLYIIAGLEWLSHSTVLDAYVLLLGVLLVIGGCGWLLWGITYRRIGLSIIIGLLWFFMPENIRVVILEGNLPRGVINALLPFFFYFLWRVMAQNKRNAIFPLLLITSLITLCHLGITLMLIATTIIFVAFHTAMNHSARSSLCALITCISGVLLAGLWVIPALIGGAASGSSTNQVMKTFFASAFVSLNPFIRINGDTVSFYFGLSVFIICILGILLGSKNSKAGFITAVVLLTCTTKSVYELFVKLPFSQFLWMIRFVPIGLALAMVSFLLWRNLRKWTLVLFVLMLTADCATSYQYIYYPSEARIKDVQANLDKRAEETLITKAKEITNQRMALLDLSEYGSFAPYYITGVGKKVNFTFGAGWEGAATAKNIVHLNAAVENGWYVYLFDRALELGNDTVLIPIDNLKEKSNDIDRLNEAAKLTGYDLVENDGTSILYHMNMFMRMRMRFDKRINKRLDKQTSKSLDKRMSMTSHAATETQFGVVTRYTDIAIGEAASGIAMIFPSFEEGTKNNINEYTFEELANYRTIYLSGFTFNDREAAEELLLKLATSGVSIYIDMNRIPVNSVKKTMELFGVIAQSISFTDTFPKFTYQGKSYTSLDFTYTTDDWNTVYLIGLDQIDGSCDATSKQLPFLGTARNTNLHFIGLNIIYYLQTTRDAEIQRLAEAIFHRKEANVPERQIVPIQIQQSRNKLTINSEYDHVNTTLSYIDIFHSNQKLSIKHNLITVDSGTTVITMRYPHIEKGLAVTAIGLLLTILSYVLMRKMKEEEKYEKKD